MSESLESRAAQRMCICTWKHSQILFPMLLGDMGDPRLSKYLVSIFGNSFDQEVRVTDEVRTVDYITFLNFSLQITDAFGNLPGLILS